MYNAINPTDEKNSKIKKKKNIKNPLTTSLNQFQKLNPSILTYVRMQITIKRKY